jgi:DNA (cytosine-5)-methyltransferase 1
MTLFSKINNNLTLKYVDLFCGIGGFRLATEIVCQEHHIKPWCVFSSDIDADAVATYEANYGETPNGDITQITPSQIPDHNILFAGFPCQPFSICGKLDGFEDIRGTLFFDIARILKDKKPLTFVLENVKQLKGHNSGKTLARILEVLKDIGYYTYYKVFNALDFGLPQKRERIFIVGFLKPINFEWIAESKPMKPLSEILEENVSSSYYASEKIRNNRLAKYQGNIDPYPTIWHENKAGHISAYPYSCAMRSGASYNYLLVNGERRLTEREMLRLQGFPDSFKIVRSYSAIRKLVGNSVAIPCVISVIRAIFQAVEKNQLQFEYQHQENLINVNFIQIPLFKVNDIDINEAKVRLDLIINKTRTRYYKPIQIAEVLYRSRINQDIDILQLESYRTKSKRWKDQVCYKLLNQISTSSSKFQDDIWNNAAMPPNILNILDRVNKDSSGIVERYIYYKFIERQSGIIAIIEKIKLASFTPETFYLAELLALFRKEPGLKRSIDKCYEIVTYSLFETIVTGLEAEITIKISPEKSELLKEFANLIKVLLNLDVTEREWTEAAHIYRVGVTNAADRGLDMWANFGPAIQVKHLTLNENAVREIVDQVESDHIVIVCRDIDVSIITTIISQIGWARRVRGIIKESELIEWYELCLRGKFSSILSPILIKLLIESFEIEFIEASNQANKITEFCRTRGYAENKPSNLWQTKIDIPSF